MECQRTNEHTAYPVFYDVEPTEIRKQSGVVGEAFAKHDANEEATERWRDALKEAADLAGWELKNTFDGHEAKFIEKIVEEISQELRFINPSVDEKLVGMETRVEDVVSSLETNKNEIRMIGIWGMGGAGKTTLARAVFDQISFRFEGSSFVENVLLVLDDVDSIDQLEALASELSWFKPGSRVIITTREEQVLVAHGVPRKMILGVNLLLDKEANSLFNRYAFGSEVPKPSYKELSKEVVRYAAGLPLTIKVLGSFLRGKDELEWADTLERLKTIPLRETQEILEISYNGLEDDHKEIFLDVACILKGWDKERVIVALESCDLHARSGLRVLKQKSLISISYDGCLGMHDHIEEMGKNIVRRLHPNVPHRHSRLWIGEEIEDILVEDRGAEATRCIISKSLDPKIFTKGLRKMKKLTFLRVECELLNYLVGLSEDSMHLPNSLRYISWHNYPYTCLPTKFLGNNLVGLEMHSSNIRQLWKSGVKKVLKKLKFIDLKYCDLRTLDIGLTMNLEKLCLHHCSHLVELPIESFKLKFLSISFCELITTLDLVRAQNLETLGVLECGNLVELHMPVENSCLKDLNLQYCYMLKILNLMGTQNIETLKLIDCKNLVELHIPVENPWLKDLNLQYCCKLKILNLTGTHNIETLGLIGCKDLVELHMPLENQKLKDLQIIDCCELRTLILTGTQNIETINLIECKALEELHMPVENFKLKSFICKGCKLRTLDLGWVENLNLLDIKEQEDLVEFHFAVENIETLVLVGCSKLKSINLRWTRSLKKLFICNCMDMVEILMPVRDLKTIEILNSKLRTLSLTLTRNLKVLRLYNCEDLLEVHMPIESPELKTYFFGCSNLRTC